VSVQGGIPPTPTAISADARRAFGLGRYDLIRREIAGMPIQNYEAVGADVALAIALDLATSQPVRRYSILDARGHRDIAADLLRACGYAVASLDWQAIRDCTEEFDVALLDALTMANVADSDAVKILCGRIRSHFYVEVPSGAAGAQDALIVPKSLLHERIANSFRWIATTNAGNAAPQRLFRVDLR
jgi:hypothetical protein